MAHKTIAPTTELRELPCTPNLFSPSFLKTCLHRRLQQSAKATNEKCDASSIEPRGPGCRGKSCTLKLLHFVFAFVHRLFSWSARGTEGTRISHEAWCIESAENLEDRRVTPVGFEPTRPALVECYPGSRDGVCVHHGIKSSSRQWEDGSCRRGIGTARLTGVRAPLPKASGSVQSPATRNRTRDHLIAAALYSQMLYQLSYSRSVARVGVSGISEMLSTSVL